MQRIMVTAIAMSLGMVAFVNVAHAQVKRPQITGDVVADTKANLGLGTSALTGDPVADLHAAIKKGGQKLIIHLKQTYALATSPALDGSPQIDPISAPCAKALVPIVDLVVNGPKANAVTSTDPMALTPDEQTIATNASEPDGPLVALEKLRILRISLQSPSLTLSCGPLVQDGVRQAKNIAGGITSLITGTGLLSTGL